MTPHRRPRPLDGVLVSLYSQSRHWSTLRLTVLPDQQYADRLRRPQCCLFQRAYRHYHLLAGGNLTFWEMRRLQGSPNIKCGEDLDPRGHHRSILGSVIFNGLPLHVLDQVDVDDCARQSSRSGTLYWRAIGREPYSYSRHQRPLLSIGQRFYPMPLYNGPIPSVGLQTPCIP